MGFEAVGWAWTQVGLKPAAKLLLVSYSVSANDDTGECWYPTKTWAARCGMTIRAVQKLTVELAELRLLTKEARFNEYGQQITSVIRLALPNLVDRDEPQDTPPRTAVHPHPEPQDTPTPIIERQEKDKRKTVSPEFIDRMKEKHPGLDVDAAIEKAFNHKAHRNWLNLEKGLADWLARNAKWEAEKAQGKSNGGARRTEPNYTADELKKAWEGSDG